jgi:hypothetical protein
VRFGLGRFSGLAEISIPAGKNDKGSSESKFFIFLFLLKCFFMASILLTFASHLHLLTASILKYNYLF